MYFFIMISGCFIFLKVQTLAFLTAFFSKLYFQIEEFYSWNTCTPMCKVGKFQICEGFLVAFC